MLSIEITSDAAGLLGDSSEWDGLSRGVPFRQSCWLAPWWNHFGEGATAYVVVARDDMGTIRGLLPLYRRDGGTNRRILAIMGDGDACSDHVSVLARQSELNQIAYEIGRHLGSAANDATWGWDSLEIDGVIEGDPGVTALAQGLKSCGASLHASSRMSVWFKRTDRSWEDHLAHYGKTQRRKLRRWSEKIGDNAPFRQRSAQTNEEAMAMLDVLIEMHQQRWNEVGEAGSFANPRFRSFIREAVQRFLSRGQLYLTALEHEDQIVAAELSFLGDNGVLYVYSAGYDTKRADLEPGRILGVDTLRHLYRQSLSGIDYMRGDEEYKKRYASESRRLIQMRVVAPAFLPQLRHAAWCTGFELKQWARRQTGRQPLAVLDLTGDQSTLSISTT